MLFSAVQITSRGFHRFSPSGVKSMSALFIRAAMAPISLNTATFFNLGMFRIVKIGMTYAWIKLFPRRKEESLEERKIRERRF